jgi:hypothetical protein
LIVSRFVAITVAIAAIAAATAAPPSADGGSGSTKACTQKRSVTLVQDKQTRVYRIGKTLWACLYAEDRRLNLALPDNAQEYWYGLPAVKVVGPVVAWAVTAPDDPDAPLRTTIERVDLRSEGYVDFRSVPAADTRIPKVGSLVLRRDGAAAWIACPGKRRSVGEFKKTCDSPGHPDGVYTLKPQAKSAKLVARGTRIDPHSLQLRGSRITWTQRGRTRAARLQPSLSRTGASG